MVGVLGAVAEFERAIMLERQREGIAKARAAGKFKGRTPTARAKTAEVLRLARVGSARILLANSGLAGEWRSTLATSLLAAPC